MKFLKGFIITLLIIGVLVAVGFILDSTIPAVHDFFVSTINWFKELFNVAEEVVEDTSDIVEVITN